MPNISLFTFLVYFTLLILCPYFCYCAFNKYKNPPIFYIRLNIGFCFLLLIFITGLRGYTGVDYKDYVYLYQAEPWIRDSSARIEIGFMSLIKFLKRLNLPAWSLFMVMAILTYIAFYISFIRQRAYLFLGIFFYIALGFMFFSFNGVRQAFAMTMLSFAVHYLAKRRIWPYIFIVIMGSVIHFSILFFVPFYFFIHKVNISNKVWFTLSAGAILINLILVTIFSDLLNLANFVFGGLYKGLFEQSNITGVFNFLSPIYLTRILLGFLIIWYHKDIIKMIPESRVYINFSLFGVVLYNAFSQVLFISRFNNYFLYMDIFTLSYLVVLLWRQKTYRVLTLLMVYFLIIYTIKILVGDNGVTPYKFIF